MKLILQFFLLIFIFVILTILPSSAGGPLVVKGAMAVTYATRPFLYRFDKGKLGKYSNTEARDILKVYLLTGKQ